MADVVEDNGFEGLAGHSFKGFGHLSEPRVEDDRREAGRGPLAPGRLDLVRVRHDHRDLPDADRAQGGDRELERSDQRSGGPDVGEAACAQQDRHGTPTTLDLLDRRLNEGQEEGLVHRHDGPVAESGRQGIPMQRRRLVARQVGGGQVIEGPHLDEVDTAGGNGSAKWPEKVGPGALTDRDDADRDRR